MADMKESGCKRVEINSVASFRYPAHILQSDADGGTLNRNTKFALDYHEDTMHSEGSSQVSRHYMDWNDRPRPFKVYPDIQSVLLPDDIGSPESNSLVCIRNDLSENPRARLGISSLARLLFFTGGVTRAMTFDAGTYYMRAASATGALYPIEMYVICGDFGEGADRLAAGIYHFCPGEFSLTLLRAGNWRANLALAAGANQRIGSSPATIAFTSLAWRNTWKYRARSYRHWFWDSGVMAANLLALCSSEGFSTELAMGFVDKTVNGMLLLQDRKEAAIALAPIADLSNMAAAPAGQPSEAVHIEAPKSLPVARSEAEYPEIWQINDASSLSTPGEVNAWKQSMKVGRQPGTQQAMDIKSLTIGETVLRRGSTRRFAHRPVSSDALLNVLYSSTRGVPLDFMPFRAASMTDVYFIANLVDGLGPGTYFYDRTANSIRQLKPMNESSSRSLSGYLCLNQPLFADASAVLFLMCDLAGVLDSLGNRGYRAAQFEAGVIAGKIYLSAYSLALGASGSTFYDEAVTEAFSPHAVRRSAMIAVGVGVPDYDAVPGKVLAARLTKNELMRA